MKCTTVHRTNNPKQLNVACSNDATHGLTCGGRPFAGNECCTPCEERLTRKLREYQPEKLWGSTPLHAKDLETPATTNTCEHCDSYKERVL